MIKQLVIAILLGLSLSTFSIAANTDSSINSAVEAKIAADHSLAGTNIHAKTISGNVNLSGNVSSDTQFYTATELAQSVNGVKDVETKNLTVNGSLHPLDDAFITAKIKGLLIQKKLFGENVAAMSISVETNNGIVSLSGSADSQTQIDNAIHIAKSVSGVKSVTSTVKLNNNSNNNKQT